MTPILKNVLGVIAGFIIGAAVNMGLVQLSGSLIPPPEGVDMMTPEGIRAAWPQLEFKHFIFPWLAHALGTLAGAFVTARIAASLNRELALVIGCIFLMGGISMVTMVGGPTWFKIADLGFAYIPMAMLGWWFAGKR